MYGVWLHIDYFACIAHAHKRNANNLERREKCKRDSALHFLTV